VTMKPFETTRPVMLTRASGQINVLIAAGSTEKPFGNSVEQKMINAPTWPNAGSIMTYGTVSERLQNVRTLRCPTFHAGLQSGRPMRSPSAATPVRSARFRFATDRRGRRRPVPAEPQVQRRAHEEGEQRGRDQPADDDDCQRVLNLVTGPIAEDDQRHQGQPGRQ